MEKFTKKINFSLNTELRAQSVAVAKMTVTLRQSQVMLSPSKVFRGGKGIPKCGEEQ